ncbi:MAG: TonB-dependent receptor, plug [Caulobacteraceae bacterium]|nr:TonB-dependent receptor, plug [Caulobacteraceae bacterium]
MSNTKFRAALLVSTTLAAAGLATAAFAQTAPAPNANALEEVVVTATRQTSTVNKVALSVSAVTQKSLDQQGIRNVSDLSSQVPGFTFRTTGGDNNPQLTIRGVGGNAIGGTSGSAPTTGVYVDDVAMQKRNANGLVTGSGSPTPLLYDLDRIEVLRGPQGTLYGGSSEGGTLRFITPQPSLTTYSGTARVGVNTVAGGGMGNEEGFALGGPIVQDKLGFRVSGFRQDRAGWINGYSEYDGHQFASQINKGNDYSLRGSVLWQVTPDFKATLTVFSQTNYDQDSSAVRSSSPAINIPVRTFSNAGTVNGVRFSFPATVFGGYTIPAQTWFNNLNGTANGLYLTSTNVQYVPSPRRTQFTTPSLVLDYNWGDKLAFKSITSYTDDRTSGWQFTGGGGMRTSVLANYTAQPCPGGTGLVTPIQTATCAIAPQYLQLPANGVTSYASAPVAAVPGPANVFGYFLYNNRRGQTTEELRVSTIDPSWKLQFVAGLFVLHEHNHVNVGSNWNETMTAQQMRGVNEGYFAGGETGVPVMQTPGNNPVDVSTRNIDITEDEISGFGEANYAITDKLKITAGVRVTSYTQKFGQQYGGAVAGAPNGFIGTSDTGAIETNPNSLTPFPLNYAGCPSSVAEGAANSMKYAVAGCPYQYSAATLKEHPVTPKVGISYQLTSADLLYATYSEGQRPGGVNPPVPPVQCAQDLANLGVASSPLTYQHDTVKSTEVGGKFRLFNGQAQVNASAFHISWEGVQFVVPLPLCAFSFIANAAKANSDGAEIQATGRLWGFTVNGNLGYDKAEYAATVLGPKNPTTGAQAILALKGDNLGIPDWTANLGVQYDWRAFDFPAYARVDYTYTGKYARNTGIGTSSYNPATTPNFINGEATNQVNGRIGVYYKSLEIAAYVKNAANANTWVNKNQGAGNYYYTGNTLTPRIIGMQMNYRF